MNGDGDRVLGLPSGNHVKTLDRGLKFERLLGGGAHHGKTGWDDSLVGEPKCDSGLALTGENDPRPAVEGDSSLPIQASARRAYRRALTEEAIGIVDEPRSDCVVVTFLRIFIVPVIFPRAIRHTEQQSVDPCLAQPDRCLGH